MSEQVFTESAEPEEVDLSQPPEEGPEEPQPEETEGEAEPEQPKPQRMDWERVARDRERAMHAERMKRQQYESRLQQIEDSYRRLEERQRAPEKQEEQFDPNQDPIEAINRIWGELESKKRQEAEQRQQQQQQEQQRQQFMRQWEGVTQDVVSYEQDYANQTPDYYDAVNHLLKNRYQDYVDAGYRDETAIMNEIRIEMFKMTRAAMEQGVNPAQAAYNMAKRNGYRSKRESASFDKMKSGQSAARSIGGSGGKAPRGPKTYADISRIKSDEEFIAELRRKEEAAMR